MSNGLQTLRVSFTDTHLTHCGGMVLLQRFCSKLGLRRLLKDAVPARLRSGSYRPPDLILALLFAVMVGLRRINKTEILPYNGAFLSLLGLSRFPDQSTLRRFLKRLTPRDIRHLVALHDRLRRVRFPVPKPRTSLPFDLDSVVLTVYGKPPFARVGDQPQEARPTLVSSAPGLRSPSTSVLAWLAPPGERRVQFRCGGVHTTLPPESAPDHRPIPHRIRADSGFFGGTFIASLDRSGVGYAIVAREYSTIKAHARACRFTALGPGWEVSEFTSQPLHWNAPHRFVVVRRPSPADPVEATPLPLFKDRKYAYHVIVTNLTTHPWRVWQFYAKRATIEKNIRELLYDYPLAKIPTEDWLANVAFFHLLLFAFDILHWFKRRCLPPAYLYATLDSVRTDFLVLPATLRKAGSRNILALPQD
jgi:hypothetical protein